jgi:uncharacterized protein YceH (UPF0502 family)
MPVVLSEKEARVIGCLMEKSVITPDQYPMTLNGLTNACNQKSSREPVMHLEPGEVLNTVRALQDKHLVRVEENFRTQVEKFSQRLCNTPFSDYQFDEPQFAIMTVLLLRGPRTPGELKANVGRLHTFADNAEVQDALDSLVDREGGALVAQLPRKPGRRDSEYAHLLAGELTVAPVPSSRSSNPPPVESPAAPPGASGELRQRLAALEAEVAALKAELAAVKVELGISGGEQSPQGVE